MYDRLRHSGWGINRLYWGDGPKNHTKEWTADRKAWKRSDAWQWVQQNLAEPKPKIVLEAHHGQLTRNPKPSLNPNPSPSPNPIPEPDPNPNPNPNPNPDPDPTPRPPTQSFGIDNVVIRTLQTGES